MALLLLKGVYHTATTMHVVVSLTPSRVLIFDRIISPRPFKSVASTRAMISYGPVTVFTLFIPFKAEINLKALSVLSPTTLINTYALNDINTTSPNKNEKFKMKNAKLKSL